MAYDARKRGGIAISAQGDLLRETACRKILDLKEEEIARVIQFIDDLQEERRIKMLHSISGGRLPGSEPKDGRSSVWGTFDRALQRVFDESKAAKAAAAAAKKKR